MVEWKSEQRKGWGVGGWGGGGGGEGGGGKEEEPSLLGPATPRWAEKGCSGIRNIDQRENRTPDFRSWGRGDLTAPVHRKRERQAETSDGWMIEFFKLVPRESLDSTERMQLAENSSNNMSEFCQHRVRDEGDELTLSVDVSHHYATVNWKVQFRLCCEH